MVVFDHLHETGIAVAVEMGVEMIVDGASRGIDRIDAVARVA